MILSPALESPLAKLISEAPRLFLGTYEKASPCQKRGARCEVENWLEAEPSEYA